MGNSIKCWVCDNDMDFVGSETICILGYVLIHECKECGEIVYTPIRKGNEDEGK